MRALLIYSIVRVGLFIVAFVLLYWLLPANLWWLAAICSALISFSLSYIFFGGLRAKVAAEMSARRGRPATDPDAAAEDVAGDEAAAAASRLERDRPAEQ